MCLGLLFRLHLIPFPHDFWDIFRYKNPYLNGDHPYTVLKNSEFLGYLWAILHSIVLWHNIVMCLGLLLRLHLIPFPLDFWDIFGQQNSFLDGGHLYTKLGNSEFLMIFWVILHCIWSSMAPKSQVLRFIVQSTPNTLNPTTFVTWGVNHIHIMEIMRFQQDFTYHYPVKQNESHHFK